MNITSNSIHAGPVNIVEGNASPTPRSSGKNPSPYTLKDPTDISAGAAGRWRNINRKDLVVSVLTAEGDNVTLSYNVTTFQQIYDRPVDSCTLDLARSERRDVTEEGDLSECEQEEISAFENALEGNLIEIFNNGTGTSSGIFKMDMSQWKTLSSVKADYSEGYYKRWEPERTYTCSDNLSPNGHNVVKFDDIPMADPLLDTGKPIRLGTENNEVYGIRWQGMCISQEITSASSDLLTQGDTGLYSADSKRPIARSTDLLTGAVLKGAFTGGGIQTYSSGFSGEAGGTDPAGEGGHLSEKKLRFGNDIDLTA